MKDLFFTLLNYIYSKENIDDAMMNKLNEICVLVSVNEIPMTKRDIISSKLKELANLIHKNNSSLTQQHVDIANEISNELKDIPEKSIHKSLSEQITEKWRKLHYKLKILIFLGVVFGIIFILLSQILIYYGLGQQSYATAMLVSGAFTVAAFSKIDLFIPHERIK